MQEVANFVGAGSVSHAVQPELFPREGDHANRLPFACAFALSHNRVETAPMTLRIASSADCVQWPRSA